MPPPITHCVSGRLSRDPLSVPCGRRSRQNATQSSSAPSTGRTRAGVAFPAPPIEAAIGMIVMVSDAIANAQGRKRPISYTRTCEILVSHGNSQRPERRECRKDLFVERRPGGVNRIYPSLFRRRLTYFQKWCCERGLNSRPHPYQGCALPLSYHSIPFSRNLPGSGEFWKITIFSNLAQNTYTTARAHHISEPPKPFCVAGD